MKAQPNDKIVNCFSIDVEGFVESNVQSIDIDGRYINQAVENREIEKNIQTLLEILDDMKTTATFFFLGRIARDIPHIVRETAQCGHEIACHGYYHERIFGMTREEFKRKLSSAKCLLEDVSGKRVYGFRAPDFSIVKSSLWALDVLEEAGFLYDSSIYPIGMHDVYGIQGQEPFIHRLSGDLIEFPLSTVNFFGKSLPFGGGGYFRLFPLFFTKGCISSINKLGHPSMFYIHPYEVGPEIPRISGLSFYRNFRHYYNCSNGTERVQRLLKGFEFGPAIEILKQHNMIGG